MYLVIFRAKLRGLDSEYSAMSAKVRELALTRFGCIEFHALMEGMEEVALSYWSDEESIAAWRQHPEHLEAQRLGRTRWYESYRVEVTKIIRDYRQGS